MVEWWRLAPRIETTSKQRKFCYKINFETLWFRYGLRPTQPMEFFALVEYAIMWLVLDPELLPLQTR